VERIQKTAGDGGDLLDGRQKGGFVRPRRLGGSADLSDKLHGGGSNLAGGSGRIEIEEWYDVPAHESSLFQDSYFRTPDVATY
jgi:hypothetical protein